MKKKAEVNNRQYRAPTMEEFREIQAFVGRKLHPQNNLDLHDIDLYRFYTRLCNTDVPEISTSDTQPDGSLIFRFLHPKNWDAFEVIIPRAERPEEPIYRLGHICSVTYEVLRATIKTETMDLDQYCHESKAHTDASVSVVVSLFGKKPSDIRHENGAGSNMAVAMLKSIGACVMVNRRAVEEALKNQVIVPGPIRITENSSGISASVHLTLNGRKFNGKAKALSLGMALAKAYKVVFNDARSIQLAATKS
jgi:hypothetical protein